MAYVTSRSFSSPLRAAFLAFLIIPSTLADRTFWVDSSCDGKIDGAPEEVVNAAKLMFNRLNGEPQEAALNALKTVFNVQADDAKSSLAYAEVLRKYFLLRFLCSSNTVQVSPAAGVLV